MFRFGFKKKLAQDLLDQARSERDDARAVGIDLLRQLKEARVDVLALRAESNLHQLLAVCEGAPTDFEAFTGMLTRAGKKYQTWPLRWLADPTTQALSPFEGDCLVFGAEPGEGPYSEFAFDSAGALVSAVTVFQRGNEMEMA